MCLLTLFIIDNLVIVIYWGNYNFIFNYINYFLKIDYTFFKNQYILKEFKKDKFTLFLL
jgi:hypothetical protein